MSDHNIKKLIDGHFNLLQEKQEIENSIKANHIMTVEFLIKAGHSDLLTVNWTRARSSLRGLSDLS